MMEIILQTISDLHALDFDVLPGRQWWNNEFANNNLSDFKDLVYSYILNKEFMIRTICVNDPKNLVNLIAYNNEIKEMIDDLFILGKYMLIEDTVNGYTNDCAVIGRGYLDLESLVIEQHNKIVEVLQNTNISQELRNSPMLQVIREKDSKILQEVQQLWDSRILQEIRIKNSPILQEIKNTLPNRFS